MTYIVNEACIKCKLMDCIEVCPVDCFYEGENMLVIHPDECIDCGVCEPECPIEAILPDTEDDTERWVDMNRQYAATWPNITRKKDSPADSDDFKDVEGKFDLYFSPIQAPAISVVQLEYVATGPREKVLCGALFFTPILCYIDRNDK